MFTGIIEEVGVVKRVEKKGEVITLTILAEKISSSLGLGGSIAVDGVCLTVVEISPPLFKVDVSRPTQLTTTLGKAFPGRRVNLERPLTLDKPLGGHFVTGHVDAKGKILKKGGGEEFPLEISYPEALFPYLVVKGSIAVDGVSLTIQKLEKDRFSTHIIPHTAENTILGEKKVGEEVNLEVDFLARYLKKWWEEEKEKRDFEEMLKNW
ncbi:MAG TPA: riboflavin synthase [bacterium]|nr:riboflavin synthase [bacterium]HEX67786.1 riboflavin synthase [bacterium]